MAGEIEAQEVALLGQLLALGPLLDLGQILYHQLGRAAAVEEADLPLFAVFLGLARGLESQFKGFHLLGAMALQGCPMLQRQSDSRPRAG